MRRACGLREADSWFEGSCVSALTPRTDSTFLSRNASQPQPHQNPLQIAFSLFIDGFRLLMRGLRESDSWSEGSGTWFEGK